MMMIKDLNLGGKYNIHIQMMYYRNVPKISVILLNNVTPLIQ